MNLFAEMGRAFLTAVLAGVSVFVPGLLEAPDLHTAGAIALAALIAGLDSGLKALQVFVPQLSVARLFERFAPALLPYSSAVNGALRIFVAAMITLAAGLLYAQNFGEARALAIAGVLAALNAAYQFLTATLSKGEGPNPQAGLAKT